ncbi:25909_t:CDS:1, partial [Racocetra persica]
GSGYQSSLIHMYGNKQGLYVSSIEDNICKVEVYQDSQLKKAVEGTSPNDVWEHFSINKYNGIELFGLSYTVTQQLIKQHRIPTCTPNQWNDFSVIKTLYDYHLKRRTLSNINWHDLFINWSTQESNIIELNSTLNSLYPKDYQFDSRELNAWRSMFRAAGAHEITPWSYAESK